MPNIGPTPHQFVAYLTYPDKTTKSEPSLVVYRDEESIPEDVLLEHTENADIAARLVIVRTVRESAGRSTKTFDWHGAGYAVMEAALRRLEQLDPPAFRRFMEDCWVLANFHRRKQFPLQFPRR
jgi:hypothetical protein